ncbi:MAG: PspA/IM30 family protein [Pseudomonadota bacterium]
MLKLLNTLSRALVSTATERTEERHAVVILSQQVRDAAASVRNATKAVALVKAQNEQERQRSAKVAAMIADLETRARTALEKKEDGLALEAAEAIAVLEDELTSSKQAQAAFAHEIRRLTAIVHKSQTRLRELERGQRVVTARDQIRKIGNRVSVADNGALTDAEETLAKIEARQKTMDLADSAYADLTVSDNPADIIERLADAGCGTPTATRAEDVLNRLKADPAPVTPV